MADIQIIGATTPFDRVVSRRVVFTSANVGYVFFIENTTAGHFQYKKTTDGGATWGSAVTIHTGPGTATAPIGFDVWYDRWTSGDSGTKIHTALITRDTDDVVYRALDTSGDTLGTETTVLNGASADETVIANVTITKARGGNLYVAAMIDAGVEFVFGRSTDGGASWSSRAHSFEASGFDRFTLYPGNESDSQDVWLLFEDASADELTLKTYDDSADSWSESSVICPIASVFDFNRQWGGHVRHADGHLIIAVWTEKDTATADFRVFDINGAGSIVEKTAIATNVDDSFYPALFINQSTNDLYVSYTGKKDGSETLDTTASVCYVKSTDGGATWGAEVVYSATASDWMQTWTPQQGDRFAVVWSDASPRQLLINVDNSLSFGLVASFAGEGILTTPAITTYIGLTPNAMAGELQFTAPSLVTWAWEASFAGEGFLTADLNNVDWRATFAGEGVLGMPDLPHPFPGWEALFTGEGQLAAPVFTTYAWEALFAGEGALTADLTVSLSASFRGELALQEPALAAASIALAASFRGEGALRGRFYTVTGRRDPDGDRAIVLHDSISIEESRDGGTAAQMTVRGFSPPEGAPVTIALGGDPLFAGLILETLRFYDQGHAFTTLTLVGHDWHLTRRRFSRRYVNQSATAIILDVMATFPTFDVTNVEAGLPTIDDITFSQATAADILAEVMRRIGGHYHVSPPRLLYAGLVETEPDPEPFTPAYATEHSVLQAFSIARDLRQVVNRVTIIGAGTTLVEPPPGEPPDFIPRAYDPTDDGDRTVRYPVGATRLYLETGERLNPDEVDENGNPFNPRRKVPPTPLFQSPGIVLVDDRQELAFHAAGKQTFLTWGGGGSDTLTVASLPDGSLPEIFAEPSFTYLYVATLVTAWGESTRFYETFAYRTPRRTSDGSGYVWDRSFLVKVSAIPNPNVTAVKVYRQVYGPDGWGPFIAIGSTPGSGGVIIDSQDHPPTDHPDELPLVDTSQRPPLAYLDVAPLTQAIPVGASVRVMTVLDDLPSQAYLSVVLSRDGVPDDGIVEGVLDDSDLTPEDFETVGRTYLEERSFVEIAPSWDSRDPNTRPGRTQFIDMPDLQGAFTIERVRIDSFVLANYDGSGLTVAPIFHATAKRERVSIHDLLAPGSRFELR